MKLDDLWQYLSPRARELAAADIAELVLPIFEREYPNDDRPRKAIAAARSKTMSMEEKKAAASAAAYASASAAAYASRAAYYAARAAYYAALAATSTASTAYYAYYAYYAASANRYAKTYSEAAFEEKMWAIGLEYLLNGTGEEE